MNLKSSDPHARRIALKALHDKVPDAGAWKLDAAETEAVLHALPDVERIASSEGEWANNRSLAIRVAKNLKEGPAVIAHLRHPVAAVRTTGFSGFHRRGKDRNQD